MERNEVIKMFKVGDLVYVSNPDTEYEKEYGERTHKSFFGTVTEVTEYTNEICVGSEISCNTKRMCNGMEL